MDAPGQTSAPAGDSALRRLLGLGASAYRVAVHVLGSAEGAEDVVQQAYLEAMLRLRSSPPPEDEHAWFLTIVTYVARNQLRGEARRRKREAMVSSEAISGAPGRAVDEGLAAALGSALGGLDARYRLPLALCYQEGLSQRQAAAVLDMPERTVSKYVGIGLEQLRSALAKAGYAAATAAIVGGLAQAAPPVPATLLATIEKIVSGQVTASGAGSGSGAAAASAVAKGGIAMKVIAGVVGAAVLAGAVAVAPGLWGNRPSPLPSSPGRGSEGEGKPAPVNDYKGMQEREEVFEFAEKPKAAKEGDKTVITFASKGKCDATVAILDKDGKVVRHLASGVLGVNAPYPFQQNSLSQKVEWDGEDDMGKKAPAGCSVRVSLGLKPVFERNIAYDAYDLPAGLAGNKLVIGNGPNGEIVIMAAGGDGPWQGRVYGKDGKYLRTFWPPPAKDVEKMKDLGYKFATTKWGDKVVVANWHGPFCEGGAPDVKSDAGKVLSVLAGVADAKEAPRPAALPASSLPKLCDPRIMGLGNGLYQGKFVRLAADPFREEIFVQGWSRGSVRFDGKTGKADESWFPKGELHFTEAKTGPDGLLYLRVGGITGGLYGQWIVRMDPATGKTVPFTGGEAAPLPEKEWPDAPGEGLYCGSGWCEAFKGQHVNSIWTGTRAHSPTHSGGLYVSPRGMLAVPIRMPDCGWGKKHGLPADWPQNGANKLPVFNYVATVGVWDKEGNFLTANAVGGWPGMGSHGIAMDRDGSLYMALGGTMPAGQKCQDGITDVPLTARSTWGGYGTLVKFRGQGGKYPVGHLYSKITKEQAPAGALKLDGTVNGVEGALWTYGGLIGQSDGQCTCHNVRYDMDYYARHWLISGQLYSVTVLDANGNRVARLGRYGNVDDSDEDVKAGKDGLRFAWMRALSVTDKALYACDTGNRRILKAAIKYAAEETVPAP